MKIPCILATRIAAAATLLCFTTSLHAADRFWIDPLGGTFSTSSNWSATDGGAGGATVPVAADTAKLTLNNTYTVTFIAAATNTALDAENGNVTFNLGGITYTLTSPAAVEVGDVAGQTGRLTVLGGTLRVDSLGDDVTVGSASGSTGFLTVTTGGILGIAALAPDIFVGRFGTGTLTINDNGQIDGNLLSVGDSSSGTGTMNITGPNALVNIDGSTTIGTSGAGTLTVSSGGTLTSTGAAVLGSNLGANGTATVSGAGSSWSIATTTSIGNSGDGSLTISSGGLLSSTGAVTFGTATTGVGTATVSGTGSRWNLSSSHTIGSSGLGVMTVSSGGQVNSTSTATLGANSGGEGRVTVTGAGSQWTLGGTLAIGGSGTGELLVSAGGEVFTTASVVLGSQPSGIGEATITGAGSKLTASSNVELGLSGTGTLHVASGAEVYVGNNLSIFNQAAAPIGTLNFNGGSIYVAGNFTNNGVFNFTDGLLRVAGNFQPSAGAAQLVINGTDNDDLPTLELLGAGATTNVTSLFVGNNHRGQLLLREGRVFDLVGNFIAIGGAVGGEGAISVQSGAQLITTGNLSVGGAGAFVGGKGTLEVAGGTVNAGVLRLFQDGTIHLSSGTLAFDTAPTFVGQFNWTGGTLRFDSAISLTNDNVPNLLGLDGTIKTGQTLASALGINVTLATPVIVDGGTLNVGNALNNNSTLEVRSGSATVAGTISNASGAQLVVERNLSIGTALGNLSGGRIELVGGTGRLLGAGSVLNDGLILGDGTISNAVTNSATGKIRVDAGKTLFFTGTVAPNAGEINLQGGTLDFSGALTNSATGSIAGRGALYTGGLTNNGPMAFSAGFADIHGDVTNSAGGVVTTGGGGVTTFFDDVVNQGQIRTNSGARTVIFGAISGVGSFPGTGIVEQLGDTRPGNSPAIVSYGGDLVLSDTSRLFIEIGGVTAGSQYDRLSVAGRVNVDGALDAALIGGFHPQTGDIFQIVSAGSLDGRFASVSGQDIGGGLLLNTVYTANSLSLLVAIPGDANLNGEVNFADLGILLNNFNQPGVWVDGDFDNSDAVDFADLGILLNHYNQVAVPISVTAAPVPEPSTLALAVFGTLGLLIAARRKR